MQDNKLLHKSRHRFESIKSYPAGSTQLDERLYQVDVYPKLEVDNIASTKQDVIGDNDLTISNTHSLQQSLESKQNRLPAQNALQIQQVEYLQTYVEFNGCKENVYYINEIDNMMSQKQPTLHENSLTINMTSGLLEALNSKQHVIGSNSLSFSQVANLQPSLYS
jgi:hypothetical protein